MPKVTNNGQTYDAEKGKTIFRLRARSASRFLDIAVTFTRLTPISIVHDQAEEAAFADFEEVFTGL